MTEDALCMAGLDVDDKTATTESKGCASVAGALAENENVLEAWAGGSAGNGGLQRRAI